MLHECIDTVEHIGTGLESRHYKANIRILYRSQDTGWIEYNDETLTKYGEEETVVCIKTLLVISSISYQYWIFS